MRPFALAAVASVLLAGSAQAASLQAGWEAEGCDPSACAQEVLEITAAAGELNRMEVTPTARGVAVKDAGAPLRGCRPAGDGVRLCRGSFDSIEVELGDGADILRMAVSATVSDGPGDDWLSLQDGSYEVGVGPGADLIELESGSIEYGSRQAPVSVRLNGLPDDGEAGEGDDIRGSVGFIVGGSGDDLLEAGALGAALIGGGGADTLRGGPANDTLTGDDGDDMLLGHGGDDVLHPAGGPGDSDVIVGGAGTDLASYHSTGARLSASIGDGPNDGAAGEGDDIAADVENLTGGVRPDVLVGDAGPNVLDGGYGADSLRAGAGADTLVGGPDPDLIDAGPGSDTVEAGAGDWVVTADGEADRVNCGHSGLPLEWDPVDVFSACAPRLVISYRAKRHRRSVLVNAHCEKSAADACSGTLTLRRRGKPVSAPFRFRGLPPGAPRQLRLRLLVPVRGCLGAVATTVREEPPSRTRSTQVGIACRS